MNAAALAALAQNYSKTSVDTVLGGDGIIGLGLAVLCLAVSMLMTWAFLHLFMVFAGAEPRPPAKSEAAKKAAAHAAHDPDASPVTASTIVGPMKALLGEGFMLIRMEQILAALWDTLLLYLKAIANSALDTLASLLREWSLYLGILIVIIVCFVGLEFHDIILEVSFEFIQCSIRPTLDEIVFPFLNIGRVFYALAWPFVNALADIVSALTWGNVRIFLACSSTSIVDAVVRDLLAGLRALVVGFIAMTVNLLNNGRWDMLPALTEFGNAFNATRALFDCYCADAGPLLDFIYAVPTEPSLYVAIDCYVNTNIRFVQLFLNAIFKGETLNTTLWADDATCATFAIGSFAEDVFFDFCEFLMGVYELLAEIIDEMSVDARSVMFTRVAAMHARADLHLDLPASLRAIRQSPGAVPMRALAVAAMNAVDQSITAAHGPKASLFVHVDPLILRQTNTETLPNISLVVQLGISALLRVAATPWSGIFTGPVAIVIGSVNLTVNAIFHPFQAFGSAAGIAFFQYGLMGDYTRMIAIALVDLLAFIDDALPCTFSKPAQVLVSTFEAIAEVVTGLGFAAQFPPWQVGVPPPFNCSVVNCSRPAPADWSPFDTLPAYYKWNTSRLSRNLELLAEGGECTAFLLGCNTTADNNNSTNATSNCTDAPLACTARSLNRVAVSAINLTLAFLLLSPDLFQFWPNRTMFSALPVLATQVAIEDFLLCLGLLIDEFDPDGNMCMTPTPPGPQPPGGPLNLPPDDPIGVFGIPPRTQWECRIDGGAYYWDGRQVIVLNASDFYDLNQTQYRCLINESRECIIANSSSVEVLGSAPEDNVTLLVSPRWVDDANASALMLVYNATSGTSLLALPNASALADLYNVSNVTQEDCTRSTPPPPMLSPMWACDFANASIFIAPYARDTETYIASFLYSSLVPPPDNFPCQTSLPPTYTCDSNGKMHITTPLGERVIYYQHLQAVPLIDSPVLCVANSYPPRPTSPLVCQYNTLAYLALVLPGSYNASLPAYWPVYYYPDPSVSSTRVPLACENEPPTGYVCQNEGGGVGIMSIQPSGALLQTSTFVTTSGNLIFYPSCENNTLTTSPTCTRITIEYTTGPNVVIELEGGEVRVYANNTKEAVPCVYQGITNSSGYSSAGAAMKAEDEMVAASSEGVNLHQLVRNAQAYITQQRRQRDVVRPIFTAQALAYAQSHPLPTTLPLVSRHMSAERFLAQRVLVRQALLFGANVSVYRVKSLVCCFSEVVTLGGTFVVETVYAVLYLLQGILTLEADPNYSVELPTFAAARDALRDALCALSCEIMAFLPFTLSCPNSAGGTCNDLTACGRNFLCDVADVFIVAVDLLVNLLIMIRALLLNEAPPPGSNILGTTCTAANPSQCLTSFIVFIVISPIQALMQASRTFAGTADCLFCSLARLALPEAPCVGIFFAVINTLATVIDSVATTIITVVVNLVLGIVQFFIYFFAGQFGQAWNAFSTYVLGFLFSIFTNFALLILGTLERLPIIGPIITNILSFFNTACTTVSHILTTFGARPLECISTGFSLKRGLSETNWLATLARNVTAVWETGGAAASACAASMIALNATNLYEAADDPLLARSLAFCTAAHLWVGPTATPAADPDAATFPHPCDILMPTIYAQGQPLAALDAPTQARVIECVDARLRAEFVRAAKQYTGTWIPHDLYYPGSSAAMQLASDAMVAHAIWKQYSEDRLAVASQLVSPSYAASWAASDYDTTHLASLSASESAASVYGKVLSDSGDFSLDAYARRAIATATHQKRSSIRVAVGAMPTAERVVGIAQTLWEPVFSPTSAHSAFRDDASGEPISLVGDIMQSIFKAIDARNERTSISIPLTINTFARMFQANDTRLLHQTAHGFADALADASAALVRTMRALTPTTPIVSGKRALETAISVPAQFYYAFRGALALAHEFLTGKAGTASAWIRNNATIAWLVDEVHPHQKLRDPYTTGAWQPRKSLVSTATSSLLHGMADRFLPIRHRNWFALIGRAFADEPRQQSGSSSSSSSSHYSSVSMRRMRMSRLAARVSLIATDEARNGAFLIRPTTSRARVGAAQISNATGLTCLFSVANTTGNTTTLTFPLCDTCAGLDQFLGRVQRSVYDILFDFGVAVPTCPNCTLNEYPSINYTITQFAEFDAYTMNPNARVRVGDSPELHVRFPWKNVSNWRWFGDSTPNKQGFATLSNLWSATIDYVRGAVGALPPVVVTGNSAGGGQYHGSARSVSVLDRVRVRWRENYTLSDSPIHGPMRVFLGAVGTDAATWIMAKPSATAASTGLLSAAATTTVDQGPFTSFDQVVAAWLNYFVSFFLCPYPELFLNTKRFSLAETMLIGIAIFLVSWAVAQALFPGQLIITFAASLFITVTLIACSWLILTYEYGFFCFLNLPPALPVGLADDGMDMLAYNLLPKCGIGYGVVNEDYYDNSNCYQCANWRASLFTVPNFYRSFASGGRFGFSDIRYNLAFVLRAAFPSTYAALRPGGAAYSWPVIGALLHAGFFQTPLAAYANFDPVTVPDTPFAQFWQGATWVTGILNLLLASSIIYLVYKVFGTFIVQTFAFIFAVLLILLPMLLFVFTGFYVFASFGLVNSVDALSPENQYDPLEMFRRDFVEQHYQRRRKEEEDANDAGDTTDDATSIPLEIMHSLKSSSSLLLL